MSQQGPQSLVERMEHHQVAVYLGGETGRGRLRPHWIYAAQACSSWVRKVMGSRPISSASVESTAVNSP